MIGRIESAGFFNVLGDRGGNLLFPAVAIEVMQQTKVFLIQSENVELPIRAELVEKRRHMEIPPDHGTGGDWAG